jgi:primary-amine oxidase
MIDGLKNSVIESDIIPLPEDDPANFAGNGFTTTETVLKQSAWRDYDDNKERRWRIVNPARKHYSSGKEVGYTLGLKGAISPLMARQSGWVARRAPFANHPMWVLKSNEDVKGDRMWPAGKYDPQTRSIPKDSLQAWVDEKANVENEDILVFATVGESPGLSL